jgi:hypothetical protein
MTGLANALVPTNWGSDREIDPAAEFGTAVTRHVGSCLAGVTECCLGGRL